MARSLEEDRKRAVARVRSGESVSVVAASYGHTDKWLRKWLRRSQAGESEWFRERPRKPLHSPARCSPATEKLLLRTRERLEREGLFHSAAAVRWELEESGASDLPAERTIARVFARHGAIHRGAGPYVTKGKKCPTPLNSAVGAVQQADFVGPRFGKAPLRFYSLNSVELSTGRCAVEPVLSRDAQSTIAAFWATWLRLGLPRHQQVDNEMVFYGSRRYPRAMGPLIRLCLLNGIEPWFIPVGEPWRNGVVEKFNDWYGQRFLRRVPLKSLAALRRESRRFEERHNTRFRYSKLNGKTPLAALRASGTRLRLPGSEAVPRHPLPKPETGRYHLVRFVRSDGRFDIFGEHFQAPAVAHYEYVRLTIDVERQRLGVYIDGTLQDEHPYRLR
jgi:putative transposase